MERLILNTVNGEIKFEYCEWRDSFWILWMERCILNTVNWEIKFEKKEKINVKSWQNITTRFFVVLEQVIVVKIWILRNLTKGRLFQFWTAFPQNLFRPLGIFVEK